MNIVKHAILLISCILSSVSIAQSVDEIKQNRDVYLWGEGTGATLKKADQEALAMLISQISTTVDSRFEQLQDETRKNNSFEFREKVHSVINTYSNATLNNAERIVISNEPDARVFRYIKRDDVAKVFRERENKIHSFLKHAGKAEEEARIADALRYYYWSFMLLLSHPDCNSLTCTDKDGAEQILISWIRIRMESILSGIRFSIQEDKRFENSRLLVLGITYNGKPVSNFDYSYWDGRDYTNIISAKDGQGFIEFCGVHAKDVSSVKIKAEYMFESEARYDDELESVMENIDPVAFRNSYYSLKIDVQATPPAEKAEEPVAPDVLYKGDIAAYEAVIDKVVQAIDQKKYDDVKPLFTQDGFDIFNRLISYGNAGIVDYPPLKAYKMNESIMCRPVRMSFDFKNNYKRFVEDVVFHFNREGRIESLSFGLSRIALLSILEKSAWSPENRLVLINFLEHFKTAYALKRLDYIESIFSDDAVIITGHVLEVRKDLENPYRNNYKIRYNRQTKDEYLRNLKFSFGSKEYINIQFEESEVRKGGTGGNIYGVTIKQKYNSSNYGDVGYLFLIVDLNKANEPVIHVRTWQPDKVADTSIYSLSDF